MNVRTTSKEPCSSSVGSPHETNPNVEIVLPLAEVVGLLQEGVGHLMREAGLLLLMGVMAEEVDWSGRYANNVPLTNFSSSARRGAVGLLPRIQVLSATIGMLKKLDGMNWTIPPSASERR